MNGDRRVLENKTYDTILQYKGINNNNGINANK